MDQPVPQSVTIEATARLHLGFLDLNFGLGRRYGSLGLSLAAPTTRVTLRPAPQLAVRGADADRAEAVARQIGGALGLPVAASIDIETAIPAHSGLGSGTQLALALGAGLQTLAGRKPDIAAVAGATARGARSGIGIGAFATGGLLLDGGRGARTAVPPILARLDFPAEWRVLLVFDPTHLGVHGPAERAAFGAMPPMAAEAAGEVCRRVLLQALPAVVERDLPAFGAAVTAVQRIVGEVFAPFQGGAPTTSPAVGAALAALAAAGAHGVGQSSWGPTGFAFFPDSAAAAAAAARVGPPLVAQAVAARNAGAAIAAA